MYLTGDTGTGEGIHRVVWDAKSQGVIVDSPQMVFTIACCDELYVVIDLSSGDNSEYYPVSYLYEVPSGGWTDEHKTIKLVLRRIHPGSFKMCGQYYVTLTKPFYIGVFEVTQKQYELVMGVNPSCDKGDMRPVERVSYDMIRGTSNGAKWPLSSSVDSDSFMGRIRIRSGLNIDIPTEAQWEYACRAGTTTAFYNGGDAWDNQLGRCMGNSDDGKGGYSEHTTVGSYLPNAWGLYDMYGNVEEWCLDRYSDNLTDDVVDPVGPTSGAFRVERGGCWFTSSSNIYGELIISSSYRGFGVVRPSSSSRYGGFRVVRNLTNQ